MKMLKTKRHSSFSYTRAWWMSRDHGWRHGAIRQVVLLRTEIKPYAKRPPVHLLGAQP